MPDQDAALAGDGEDGGAQRLPGHGGHVPLQAVLQRGDGGAEEEEESVMKGKKREWSAHPARGAAPRVLSPALTAARCLKT